MRALKAKDKGNYERLFIRENNWHMMVTMIIYNYTLLKIGVHTLYTPLLKLDVHLPLNEKLPPLNT